MHFFDVIFATRLLDEGTIHELWRQQEAGSLEYVAKAKELQDQHAQRLTDDSGGDLRPLFGFNITTSIGAMLPSLPQALVSTTCEFPAVLSLLHRSGSTLTAWVCPFKRNIVRKGPTAPHTLLLVSHVDYISGRDIVQDVVDTLADDPLATQTTFTVIVDGAHGLGNNCAVSDIAKVRAAFDEKLSVKHFVYLYDHNKWLHGYPGLAVALHTGVRAPSIESIFPRRSVSGFAEFDEPISVSYNPLLPQWLANFMGPCANAFDRGRLQASEELASSFTSLIRESALPDIQVYESNTNMALLMTENPRRLFHFLEEHGYRSHLMGGSKIRLGTPGGSGGVRLTFSSQSVDSDAVAGLVSTLRRF